MAVEFVRCILRKLRRNHTPPTKQQYETYAETVTSHSDPTEKVDANAQMYHEQGRSIFREAEYLRNTPGGRLKTLSPHDLLRLDAQGFRQITEELPSESSYNLPSNSGASMLRPTHPSVATGLASTQHTVIDEHYSADNLAERIRATAVKDRERRTRLNRLLEEARSRVKEANDGVANTAIFVASRADTQIYGAEFVIGTLTLLRAQGYITGDGIDKVIAEHAQFFKEGKHPLEVLLARKDLVGDRELETLHGIVDHALRSAFATRLISQSLLREWGTTLRSDPKTVANRYYFAITGRQAVEEPPTDPPAVSQRPQAVILETNHDQPQRLLQQLLQSVYGEAQKRRDVTAGFEAYVTLQVTSSGYAANEFIVGVLLDLRNSGYIADTSSFQSLVSFYRDQYDPKGRNLHPLIGLMKSRYFTKDPGSRVAEIVKEGMGRLNGVQGPDALSIHASQILSQALRQEWLAQGKWGVLANQFLK